MDFSVVCTLVNKQVGALLTSFLIEAIAAVIVGYCWLGKPFTLATIAIAATLITHPFVWLLLAMGEGYLSYELQLFLVELMAVGVEAIAFHWVSRYPLQKSAILSLITNSSSLLFGILIYQVFRCQ